ncbi:S8 family serine peptidase [Rhodococcus sp. NPDC059968]|uniref:S8 family serine peptidase n=1 Tax=Rhodococcus sp. NPDC059968 TaxID=3347017 RepID=UPI003671E1A4
MAKTPEGKPSDAVTSSIDELLLAAVERGDESLETGRYIVTFKEGAVEEGIQALGTQGFQAADTRDFESQALSLEDIAGTDADAVVFPEVGAALVGAAALDEHGVSAQAEIAADSPFEAIEPEYFAFAEQDVDYLRGFTRATEVIARDLNGGNGLDLVGDADLKTQVLGATWGLIVCTVPPSLRSGAGSKVAVLDTGMDLGHPDFAGRPIVSQSFVGQPVHDLHSHGTHCIGTACGPKAPPGTTPRYGIGYRTPIFAGKVLSNTGAGTTGVVLNGLNWAIANRCPVISMSLGSQAPVQAAYTAAGTAALNNGCLIIAAAGNAGAATGAPANSPTIMSVASLDRNLTPSSFSNRGKIEIAAPGRDIFSSVPRPTRYGTKSGTSMATPHVAGCAALWAETGANLRGRALWTKLQATARPLPFPAAQVGRGLVQAP